LLTAVISIVLGMGMPTAAIYIVLATVIAPALVEMKITPMAAHLFLFYFGLLSMLTPPVAVASMVAAGLAGADMWRTGIVGVLLASSAYLLPFFWVFNPAILLDGSITAITLAILSVLAAALMLAQAAFHLGQPGAAEKGIGLLLFVVMLVIGSSTLWIGQENLLVLVPTVAGYALVWWLNRMGGAHVILQQSPG
jgi:TRAP-type uncharacterized transport system fused permease subunit